MSVGLLSVTPLPDLNDLVSDGPQRCERRRIVIGNRNCIAESLAADAVPIVWFSRRDSQSYAGFLWLLSQLSTAQCEIIDVTNFAISPADLSVIEIISLLNTNADLDFERRKFYHACWSRLVTDDLEFRIVDPIGMLISKPISYFDPALISYASIMWKPVSKIISDVLGSLLEGGVQQISDAVLHSPVRTLVEQRVFESRGDLTTIRACNIRLIA